MLRSSPSIIIIGAGSIVSLSLGRKLAWLGWDIALISRSQDGLEECSREMRRAIGDNDDGKIVTRIADYGHRPSLLAALDWAKRELQGVDVLCYNAARVSQDNLMRIRPEVLEADFNTSITGTLVSGQWFAENANKSEVSKGTYPVLMVPTGALHLNPKSGYTSVSTIRAASHNLIVNFSQILAEQYQVKTAIPMIIEPISPDNVSDYKAEIEMDIIVNEIFMPFFEARKHGDKEWIRERVWLYDRRTGG